MRILLILVFCALAGSCQKSNTAVADPARVKIAITTPADGQMFTSKDTVHISGSVQYEGEMHGYEVTITDTATGIIVYDEAQHVHTDHFEINGKWTTTVTKPVVFRMVVASSIDHGGDTARKELYFTMTP